MVVVPSCFDEVGSVALVSHEVVDDQMESSTMWQVETLATDERVSTFTVGTDVAGFTTTKQLVRWPDAQLFVVVVPVAPGPQASGAFRFSELRDDQLYFDGEYGTVGDFEGSKPSGQPFGLFRSIVIPLLLIVVLPLFTCIVVIVFVAERLQQRREDARGNS